MTTLGWLLVGLYFFIGLSLAVAIFIRMSPFEEAEDDDDGCARLFAIVVIIGSFVFIWPAIIVGAQIAKILPSKESGEDGERQDE